MALSGAPREWQLDLADSNPWAPASSLSQSVDERSVKGCSQPWRLASQCETAAIILDGLPPAPPPAPCRQYLCLHLPLFLTLPLALR
jgi:hypothetical protein